ncbi:methyltransferase family protein, partial [[Eubacterium] cellulosolvens]
KILMFYYFRYFPWRILLVILFIVPLIFIQDFYIHFYAHFIGTILPYTISHQWHIVILNIVIFISFLIPLSFRRKINWKEYGLVSAFFISLFIEMYGVPLTIFFAAKSFSGAEVMVPNVVHEFNFFGINIRMTLAMVYGTILMVIGTILILIGWVTLYKNLKKSELVTTGIYSYSRHPQYLGFILIILGWLVGWPTILSLVFAIILIVIYIRVSVTEEHELEQNLEYQKYKKKVPFFI